jgi:hypothetical protein
MAPFRRQLASLALAVGLLAVLLGYGATTAPPANAATCGGFTCITVTISLLGNGTGSWKSTDTNFVPNGLIDCEMVEGVIVDPSTCTHSYADLGLGLELYSVATPATGSDLCFTSGGTDCYENFKDIRHFDADGTMTGYLFLQDETLTVTVQGPGYVKVGTVSCSSSCPYPFYYGQTAPVYAYPDPGYALTGWSGACTGASSPCQILMTSDRSVTATFGTPSYAIHVVVNGSGTVTSSPAGVSCTSSGGSGCTRSFTKGTSVRLTAAPAGGSAFSFWGAACVGQDATCDLVADGDQTASAFFVSQPATPGPTAKPGQTATPGPTATARPGETPGGTGEPGATQTSAASADGTIGSGSSASTTEVSPSASASPDASPGAGDGSSPLPLGILGGGLLIGAGAGGVYAVQRRRRAATPEEPGES